MRILLTALPWGPVVTASLAALGLLSLVAIWPESGFAATGIRLGLVCLAASASFVLDEPAAAAVNSAPTTLRARTALRLVGVAVPASVGACGLWAIKMRLATTSSGRLPYGGLLLQLAGCLLLGLATAALTRRFIPVPGDLVSGVVAGVLTTLVIYNPFARWVDVFPLSAQDRGSPAVALWTIVCLLCMLTLARATRDPLD
jgi:fluoride ion exporter CrcB/FEX